jgi:hypothetical protein
MSGQYRYSLTEVEIHILRALAEKKERDRRATPGNAFDGGLLEGEIDTSSFRFGDTARRRALASLVVKGDVMRKAGVKGQRKPYHITETGEQRLAEDLHLLQERIENTPTSQPDPRPDDDDPKAIGWLARKYAEAMFPGDTDKKSRGR